MRRCVLLELETSGAFCSRQVVSISTLLGMLQREAHVAKAATCSMFPVRYQSCSWLDALRQEQSHFALTTTQCPFSYDHDTQCPFSHGCLGFWHQDQGCIWKSAAITLLPFMHFQNVGVHGQVDATAAAGAAARRCRWWACLLLPQQR